MTAQPPPSRPGHVRVPGPLRCQHCSGVLEWEADDRYRHVDRKLDASCPGGSFVRPRVPEHLTGSDRPGGGDPLGDYLHLKGEGR